MPPKPIDPVALTQSLIRCQSVTPAEGGALTLLEGVLSGAGFECHRMTFSEPGTPDVDNLYARIGQHGPNLCFAGHTDVVPTGDKSAWFSAPFAAEMKDGVLYGRGAVDMKGGVACFAAAAIQYLAETPEPPGSISFLITGDEEGPAINGTAKVLDWLKARDERLDACLVGEPSNPKALGDEIKIGRRGSLNGHILVHGKQGHSAYPQKADNPVPKLARLIDRLSNAPIDDGTEHFQPSNLQVTVLGARNDATNVIPAVAEACFNIRYNDIWSRERLEERVRLQCAAASEGRDIRYDVTFSGTGGVFLTKPGPLVSTIVDAVQAVTGRTPELTTGGGTSDARFIKDHCPVVEFGLVNETIHQIDERVPVEDLHQLTKIYKHFIGAYFDAV